jgi:Heterokaryon incompatibility protein (HET)
VLTGTSSKTSFLLNRAEHLLALLKSAGKHSNEITAAITQRSYHLVGLLSLAVIMAVPSKRKRDEVEDDDNLTRHQSSVARLAQLLPGARSHLCAPCEALNLDDILSHPERIKNYTGKRILMEWQAFDCPLCRLLTTVLPLPATSESQTRTYSLFAFSSGSSYATGLEPLTKDTIQKTKTMIYDTVILGLLPKHLSLRRGEANQERYALLMKRGFIAPVRPSHCAEKPGFRVRRLGPELDWDILRGWMNFCQSVHGQHTNSRAIQPPKQVPGLRVIDCASRQIIVAPKGCDYVTLSYVWGPPALEKKVSRVQSSPRLLRKELPSTIEDAIKVVVQLQHRYLWVDRYCID